MRPNWLFIIETAIENGVLIGWRRSHKHTDTPTEDDIQMAITDEIMHELHQVIDFESPECK